MLPSLAAKFGKLGARSWPPAQKGVMMMMMCACDAV